MTMGKIFKRGLIALAPISLTIAFVIWLFRFFENMFSVPLKAALGDYYFRGLGILVALVLIFLVGSALNTYILQKLSALGERILAKIPFVKTLYNSIVDMMSHFQPKDKDRMGKVVTFEVGDVRLIGLVTREDFEGLPEGVGRDDEIAVFIPMSYQIGGITLFVRRSKITPVAMTVEEGMRFIVTAGVATRAPLPDHKKKH